MGWEEGDVEGIVLFCEFRLELLLGRRGALNEPSIVESIAYMFPDHSNASDGRD